MADQQTSSFSSRTSKSASGNVVETIDLVKEYAKQEALGPLRGAGRWVAFGLIGALSMASGVLLVVLGVLRLVQNEFGPTFAGRWMSLPPYLIALVVALAIMALAASRIKKSSLHKD